MKQFSVPSLRCCERNLLPALYQLVLQPTPTTRREDQLLLLLLTTQTNEAALSAARALMSHSIDWTYLIEQAEAHRVGVLVYLRLQACFSDVVPYAVMNVFTNHYQTQRWNSLHSMSELIKTVTLLEKHDIAVLPLKGPVLALTLYENLYARRYKDIDLLIHKPDLDRAIQLLIEDGYRHADWVDEPMKISSEFYESQHVTLVRVNQAAQALTQLELHWSVATSFDSFEHDSARLWGRLQPTQMGGFRLLGLPPDEVLLLLCIHGTKHMWMGLHWVVDIAEFMRRKSLIDWAALLAAAQARRTQRLVLVSLLIAHYMCDTPLPALVAQAAQRDPISDILARYNAGLIFHPEQTETIWGQVRGVWFHSLLRETWSDRLPYLAYVIRHKRSQSARRLVFAIMTLIIVLVFFILLN